MISGSGWFETSGPEKYIITNVHNIAENNTGTAGPNLAGMITVSWMDPVGDLKTENAELQKYLPKLDVAMLKVGNNAAYNLPVVATLGTNRTIGLEGKEAMTIGHPYGKFNYKLSRGLVEDARCDDASWMSEAVIVDYETFGGNSGGPIFNSDEEIIGMHTWAYESMDGSCSAGDAWDPESCKDQGGIWSISADRAEQMAGGIGAYPMQQLINAWITDLAANPGNIGSLGDWGGEWGAIGIQYENMNISKFMDLVNNAGMPANFGLQGCYVTKTQPAGAALTAGLLEGDIILSINGIQVGPSHAPQTSSLAMEVGLLGHTAAISLTYATKASNYGSTATINFLTNKMVNVSNWIRTAWI